MRDDSLTPISALALNSQQAGLQTIHAARRFCLCFLQPLYPGWPLARLQQEAEALCRYILLGFEPEDDNAMLLALLNRATPPADA